MASEPIEGRGASFSYSNAGTNTLTQVVDGPCVFYHVSVSHQGGSVGFLQLYNNGTADAGAGTPDMVFAVNSGTAGAGTPTLMTHRDIDLGPFGAAFNGGLSYLWAAGATGTTAHGVNANVTLVYRGTALP